MKRQQKIMTKLYDDPELRSTMERVTEKIRMRKDEFYENEEIRQDIKEEQHKILQELTKLKQTNFKLKESKIKLENGKRTDKMNKAMMIKEEMLAVRKRTKLLESIMKKKQSHYNANLNK